MSSRNSTEVAIEKDIYWRLHMKKMTTSTVRTGIQIQQKIQSHTLSILSRSADESGFALLNERVEPFLICWKIGMILLRSKK